MTLADIKGIIRQDADQSFRYSRFLKLLQPEIDKPDRDPNWDLWFFSDNTTFCMESAGIIRNEILEHGAQYRIIQQDKNADVKFNFIDIRRKFAAYCMFLYAALESFAHEVNIFYDCKCQRRDVKISTIANKLCQGKTLKNHLDKINTKKDIDKDIKFLIEYRHAIAHGYVFPISGTSDGLFLTKAPREVLNFNSHDLELFSFSESICDKIFNFIEEGWKCFSNDELGQPREIDQHNI
jgi:hypothetical protein